MATSENRDACFTAVRPLELLVGIRAIAAFLKIGLHRVREMHNQGAPIFRDERGVLRAEKTELWHWVKHR